LLANVRNANCITDLEVRWSYVAKTESKTDQPSLNRYQGPKVHLMKSLREDLGQNRVWGPNLDFCKTWPLLQITDFWVKCIFGPSSFAKV
jgi:hypothetical protein